MEKDKSNSFFKERYRSVAAILNGETFERVRRVDCAQGRQSRVVARAGREPCTRYIRSFLVIIVVYSWGDVISDKSIQSVIRHRRIDAIYESGIQPDLRIVKDVLFSLKDFSFY